MTTTTMIMMIIRVAVSEVAFSVAMNENGA